MVLASRSAPWRRVASAVMAKRISLAAVTGAAVLGLAAVACTGGGGGGSGSGGSLHAALASVRDAPASQRFFAWADSKELRTLSGVSAASSAGKANVHQKWLRLAGVALPSAAATEPQLTTATGIDMYAGNRAITVGVPPERASRIDGADGGAVTRKLSRLGARLDRTSSRSYLAVAGEHEVDVSNPRLADDVYLTLNRVYVAGSTVAFGLADPPIDIVLGGGRSLADVPAAAAVADCLGDVFVAEIMAPPPGGPDGATLIGLGVRRPTSVDARVTEVLCQVISDKGQAGRLAGTVGARVAPNSTMPASGQRVRDRVANAAVDQPAKNGEQLVRLTLDLVTPARAGFLMLDAGSGGISFLAGGG
jgi:hypothetical protein